MEYWLYLLSFLEDYYINYIFVFMAIMYLPSIYMLQEYMKPREPMKITNIVFYWNIFMSLMSALGFFYTVRTLEHKCPCCRVEL